MKKAFTLIELLVVVLIIGILAAIALPQYERAVLRSRFSEVEIKLNAMNQAVQRYYLANSTYNATQGLTKPFNGIEGMDIEIPTGQCVSGSTCAYQYANYYGMYIVGYYTGNNFAPDFFIPVEQGASALGTSFSAGTLYTTRSDHNKFGFTSSAGSIAGTSVYTRP